MVVQVPPIRYTYMVEELSRVCATTGVVVSAQFIPMLRPDYVLWHP